MEDNSRDNQSIAKGFAILSIAGIMVKMLSIFNTPILKRIIGEVGLGVYNSVYSVYIVLYVIANSGIPVAISKNISELLALGRYKDVVKSFKIARILLFVIGLVLSLFMFIFAAPLSKFFTNGKLEIELALKALSPTILITCILSSYRGYFQGRSNMKPTAISQILEQMFNIVFSLGFAYILFNKYGMEAGVAGATVGTTLGALIGVIILILFYERNKKLRVVKESKYNIKPYSSNKLLKKLIVYSIPVTLCVVMQNIGNLMDNKMISMILPTIGMNDNIIKSWLYQYNTLIGVPIVIITSLSAAVMPAISGYAAVNDKKNLRKKTRYAYKLCFLVAIPSAIGLFSLAEPICKILGYSSGVVSLLRYGALNIVIMAMVQIQVSIMQGIGRINLVTVYCFIGLVGKLIADFIFIRIPSINVNGVLIANFVYFAIPLILNNMAIRKTFKKKIRMGKRVLRISLSSTVMGVGAFLIHYCIKFFLSMAVKNTYLINLVGSVIAIIIAVYIYIYLLILTKSITKEDFDTFPRKILKLIPKFMLDGL